MTSAHKAPMKRAAEAKGGVRIKVLSCICIFCTGILKRDPDMGFLSAQSVIPSFGRPKKLKEPIKDSGEAFRANTFNSCSQKTCSKEFPLNDSYWGSVGLRGHEYSSALLS
jgi:hypothetical protein